jgi:hypothetical protein
MLPEVFRSAEELNAKGWKRPRPPPAKLAALGTGALGGKETAPRRSGPDRPPPKFIGALIDTGSFGAPAIVGRCKGGSRERSPQQA